MKALLLLVTVSLSTAAFAFEGSWTASRDEGRSHHIYLQIMRSLLMPTVKAAIDVTSGNSMYASVFA